MPTQKNKTKVSGDQNAAPCQHSTKLTGQCVKCGQYIPNNMNKEHQVETGERIPARVFGVWACDSFAPMGFFVGSAPTLADARKLIAQSKQQDSSRFLHQIHSCKLGWYERKFDSLIEKA
jgi:hypothetical protein